jgi:hypothetical protein
MCSADNTSLVSMNPLKHANHGIGQASPKGVTFAPNVTPVTFVEPDNDSLESDPESPMSSLFPPVATPAPPSRKRCPPGKRRSQGYIPRPPNAFMLFRADFVRQKHVPGSIETNHGSLSKIIGQFLIHQTLVSPSVSPRLILTSQSPHRQLLARSTSGGEACLGSQGKACESGA